jgi:hypothetical protein
MSPVFESSAFGGNGSATTQLVTTGPFRTWTPVYATRHGLMRKFYPGPGIGAFNSTEMVNQKLVQSTTYENLRMNIEFQVHGTVHTNIGGGISAGASGDMLTMASPNDPLFWLVHAYVDKVWASWQALAPANLTAYGGRNFTGTTAALTDLLPGSATVKVGDVMSTKALCYVYKDLASTSTPSLPALMAAPSRAGRRSADDPPLSPTRVAVASSHATVAPGKRVTLTASIGSSGGAGDIGFFVDDVPLAGCKAVPLRFTGVTWQAACRAGGLAPGARRIEARFLGAGALAPSRAVLAGGVTVSASATEVSFATPPRARYGDPVGASVLAASSAEPGAFSYTVAPVDAPARTRPAGPHRVLPAGEYDLQAHFTAADGVRTQTLTVPYVVDPAPLTIRPEDKDMGRGEPEPRLTWIASGFVKRDSPGVLLQQPACLIRDGSLGLGTHKIVCEGGAARNYRLVYPDTATLTVRREPCPAGSRCASDPPLRDSRRPSIPLICQPPLKAADRSFVRAYRGRRAGIRQTTWRGRES